MVSLYQLEYFSDGVHMSVRSEMGPIMRSSIVASLNRKQIIGLDLKVVDQLIKHPFTDGIIAPAQDEYLVDEEAAVTISKDKIIAYISFTPPVGGKLLSVAQIVALLKDAKVCYGINKDLIVSLANNGNKQYNQNIIIASGSQPVHGTDAVISIKFPVMRSKLPKILENGQVDHKNIERPNIVKNGDLLAEYTPATPGTPGKNVMGVEIKANHGKTKPIPAGKYTAISDEGKNLYSTADGFAEIIDGRITVLRVMEINGNVGASTGHIVFPGDVIVSGNVVSSYNITAGGSIRVDGCIEASIISASSDIVIRQGIKGLSAQGVSQCLVTSRGNVTAKFIENATVVASGIIRADSIVHSIISSYQKVDISGKLGSLIGGKISALESISCISIGNVAGVSSIPVTLDIGVTQNVRDSYIELKKQIDDITNEIEGIEENLVHLSDDMDLNSRQIKQRRNLKQRLCELEDKLFPLTKDLRTIREAMKNVNAGMVHVKKHMYPPVYMTIGAASGQFDEAMNNVTLRYKDGIIVKETCNYKF